MMAPFPLVLTNLAIFTFEIGKLIEQVPITVAQCSNFALKYKARRLYVFAASLLCICYIRANLRSPFENPIDRDAYHGVHCEAKAKQLTDKIDMKRLLLFQKPTSTLTVTASEYLHK